MYEYITNSSHADNVVGSFIKDKSSGFKSTVKSVFESMNTLGYDANRDLVNILSNPATKNAYKNSLLADIAVENFNDPYYQTMPAKLEQLFENSTLEILKEGSLGPLSPVVGISLPILKKSYIEGHSKDIVMTEVPTKPIVKMAFERKFLKDKQGNKYYIPEIFYDNTYRDVMSKGMGKEVTSEWFPKSGDMPIFDLDILTECGGSLEKRDSLAYDFGIGKVKMQVDGAEKEIPVDITISLEGDHTATARIATENNAKQKVEDVLFVSVDFYQGVVNVSSSKGLIKHVQFKGHLSNENNNETIEIDRERQLLDWSIPDGVKINAGLTVEKIKDSNALLDIDVVAEMIADMSTVLSQAEDSDILNFLKSDYERWKGLPDNLLGYEEGFTKEGVFSCEPPVNKPVTQSAWIDTELKYNLNRFIDELKVLLKTQDIMFVVYGHPNNITLIQDNVRWVIDEDTSVGGIQLDYRFGVMTANKNRIHVVSTLKCPKDHGLRVVAYPTTADTVTFKHFKYSMVIDNTYRNPLTPNTPNIMGTSRYKTISVLPVQGEFHLVDNLFSLGAGTAGPTAKPKAAKPVFTPANGQLPKADKTVTVTTTTPGAKIYYTLDGNNPTTSSQHITSGQKVTFTAAATLKAMVVAPGHENSEVVSQAYTIQP